MRMLLLLFSHSVVSSCLQPELQHTRLPCPPLSPELVQTHVRWVDDAIQPSHPLPSFFLLPSIFPSIKVFPNESALHNRWPNYWSFSNSPSNEYSRLISFRIDWFDLLAVQGTLKNILQHHSSKASILQHSVLLIVQLSNPYMTIGKTIALKMAWTSGGSRFTYCWSLAWRILSITLLACEMSATVK